MKGWLWLVLAIAGLVGMTLAYQQRRQPSGTLPWAHGMIVLEPPAATGDENLVPPPGRLVTTSVRLLPSDVLGKLLVDATRPQSEAGARSLDAIVRLKLYRLVPDAIGLDASQLASGRLPEPGRDEVLAGPGLPDPSAPVVVGDRTLKVVGVLSRDARLFDRSYLVPPSASVDPLFADPRASGPVHHVTLLGLTRAQVEDRALVEAIDKRFPADKGTRFSPPVRLERPTLAAYLSGLALLLLGGTGALMALYRWLATRPLPGWLHSPFAEIARRPQFFWAAHVVYFGLFFVGTLLVDQVPDAQTMLTTSVRQQLGSNGRGVLAYAGKAYASRNVAYAAAVTFLVNYPLGTLAQITLPSLLVPGLGALMGVVRPLLWGVLLGPIFEANAGGMIPHSVTLLLEGEGYILAFAFGLLVPYYIFDGRLGTTMASRLRAIAVLNVQATVVVAAVLAVAAVYEAIEVIAMMG